MFPKNNGKNPLSGTSAHYKATKHAGLSAAYDYYPFGMQMPGRVVEDATVQCIPVTKYRKVDQITNSQNVLAIAVPSAPSYNWWNPTDWASSVTALAQSGGGYHARWTSDPGRTTLDGWLTFQALPAAASGIIVDVTYTSNDHPSITGLNRICVYPGTLGVELRNLSTASGPGTFLVYTTRTGPGTIRLTVPPGMASGGNVIRLWQHYDAGTVERTCGLWYTAQAQITYTSIVSNVLQPVDQQYVVLSCDTDGAYTAGYRYGFNAQQKDDEIAGAGNSIDFKFRGYDPRLGRFRSVDPLAAQYPWNSTYAYAENKVGLGLDLEGLELLPFNSAMFHMSTGRNGNAKVVTINSRNLPGIFKDDKGQPLFSPASVSLYADGLDRHGLSFRQANNLPTATVNPYGDGPGTSDMPASHEFRKPGTGPEPVTPKGITGAGGVQELQKMWQAGKSSRDNIAYMNLNKNIASFDKAVQLTPVMSMYSNVNAANQADLTNFINDGALPTYQFGMSPLENANRRMTIMDMGMSIMNANQIPVRGATMNQYNQVKSEQQTLATQQRNAELVERDR